MKARGCFGFEVEEFVYSYKIKRLTSYLMFYSIMYVYAYGQRFGSLWWYRWYGRRDHAAAISVSV